MCIIVSKNLWNIKEAQTLIKEDKSPLYAASVNGHTEVVKLLLSKGATIDKQTINDAKPNSEIQEILEKWPHTMATLALQSNNLYNVLGQGFENYINLQEYIGKEGPDYGGKRRNKQSKKRKSINNKKKSKNNKKKRKSFKK